MYIEADGEFTHLENLEFNCNTTLHVFLRELPSFGINPETNFTDPTFCTLEKTTDWKFYKPMYVGLHTEQRIAICYEVAAIKKFCDRNNISDYIIYTGCYNLNLKRLYPDLQFKTLDYILYWILRNGSTSTITTFNQQQNNPHFNKIKHKFISTNRRYEGIRELITSYMLDYDSIISYNNSRLDFNMTFKDKDATKKLYWNNINDRLCFDVNLLPEKYKQNLGKLKDSIVADYDMDKEAGDIDDQVGRYMNLDLYYNAFCAIVSESRFFMPFGHFADKTLNAVKTFRPFILFSSPFTLEYMKSLGFKTFDKFWNESYDNETDHLTRFQKVCDVINYVNNYSVNDCKDLYTQMLPILEHNFDVLINLQEKLGEPNAT